MKRKEPACDLTEDQVKDIVNNALIDVLRIDKSEIVESAYLTRDIGMDSFTAQVVLITIEDELGISLASVKLYTVGDVYNLVLKRWNAL